MAYDRIFEIMKERELTAYRVSKDTGISQASLADWRKGRSKPKIDKLKKLADYFGVSVYYLTGEVDDFDAMRQQKIDFIHQCGADIDLSMYDDDAIDDLYVACALKKDVIQQLEIPQLKKEPSTLLNIESSDGINLKVILERDNVLSYGKHIITDDERATIKALIEAYLKGK